jgi:hypothetical protein
VGANCKDANAQYPDQAACLAACEGMLGATGGTAAGALVDTSGNTLGCRIYHAGAAKDAPAVHCAHAGPLGGDVCGSYCVNYCDLMGAACPKEYADNAACQAACGAFAAGTPGDKSGDTMQCRLYHASAAVGDAATHCPHAKQNPDAVCVAPAPSCAGYCDTVTANCKDANAQYPDPATCPTACEGLLAVKGWASGALADTSGNTLGCRTYHAGAAKDAPAVHCAHAGPFGGDVCGSYCDNYCDLMGAACPTEYADNAACQTACKAFAAGTPGDKTGDTMQCRLYHASVAVGDAATHCPHAKQSPDAVCVAPAPSCADYCDTVTANCTLANNQWPADPPTCPTACEGLLAKKGWASGTLADTSGNTLGCRIYHAGAAKDAPAVHCTHAGPFGGDVCGSYCDNYCDLMGAACPAEYADNAACQTACGAFAAGTPGDTTGDTMQCRLYHASVAVGEPVTHCPHAKQKPDSVCVAP